MASVNASAEGGDPGEWVLPTCFPLEIELLSDWHCGTGAGRPGEVDRLVARDAAGLPYLPAKTVTGMWRDACETAARALDEGADGHGGWAAWVRCLFGDEPARGRGPALGAPRPALLSVRSARMPETLRARLGPRRGASALTEAVTFVKTGVALDPSTGRARDDHLRFVEMARGGVTLAAECTLQASLSMEQRATASALLLAGAALLDHVAGDRRRGAGRCRATIPGRRLLETVWSWLETAQPAPLPGGDAPRASPAQPLAAPGALGDWLVVPLRLDLLEPVLVAPTTSGNVVTTADAIPGSVLLPVVASALAGTLDVTALVAGGQLCVLSGTLEVGGCRGRPAPASVALQKEPAADGSVRAYNRMEEDVPAGVQVKAMGGERLVGEGRGYAPSESVTPQRTARTHSTVDDEQQRPTAGVGGVYTYEALAPGQRYRSELRVRRQAVVGLPETWWSRLDGEYRIGRSKKDDYGRVAILPAAPRTFQPVAAPPAQGHRLHVWLQSTLLLRDARLRPACSAEALRAALSEALAVDLRDPPSPAAPGGPDGDAAPEVAVPRPPAALRVRREESWHVGWGLPRPSLVGLAPGSCAVFVVDGPIDPVRWREVQACGLGERHAEGYGQLVLEDPLVSEPLSTWVGTEPTAETGGAGEAPAPHPPLTPQDPGYGYARQVELAAWRQMIRRAAVSWADSARFRADALGLDAAARRPTRAQAGALREAVAGLRGFGDERVQRWLEHVEGTAGGRRAWPPDVVEAWRRLLQARDHVWRLLGLCEDQLAQRSGGLRLTTRDPRDELWAEAVRTLVDAAVRGHSRALQAQADGGGGG